MECKVCGKDKPESDFYPNDSTCKEDRKAKVRANRKDKIEYYREHDRKRFKEDSRVMARHKKYQSSEVGKAAGNKAKKKWANKNSVKVGATTIVNNSIKNGRLEKLPCEICGSTYRIHGHHDDYAYPLTVRWLCAAHHKQWHDENGEGLNGCQQAQCKW